MATLKTMTPRIFRFVLLLPHRDIQPPLREFKRRLFATGFSGAYAFPPAVPLGRTERPLSGAALGTLAKTLRSLTAGAPSVPLPSSGQAPADAAGSGFFRAGPGFESAPGLPGLLFWGLPLNIPAGLPELSAVAAEGFLPFPKLVLCIGLSPVHAGAAERAGKILQSLEPPPPVRFRAAAVANLAIRPLGGDPPQDEDGGNRPGLSFEWAMGKPRWLPKISSNGIY
jgi:hypothetical protein